MKLWVLIGLFLLALGAASDRFGKTFGKESANLLGSHENYEEPFKHQKRLVRNKGSYLKQRHYRAPSDVDSSKSNIHEDGGRHGKTRRKSEADVVQQTESNNASEAKKSNLTNLFNDPEMMLKSLATERLKMSSAAEEETSEAPTMKRKRLNGKLAGRAKAACDNNCNVNGVGSASTECPSNLENMFVCPRCRTHFVVKIHIKESKGCEP